MALLLYTKRKNFEYTCACIHKCTTVYTHVCDVLKGKVKSVSWVCTQPAKHQAVSIYP